MYPDSRLTVLEKEMAIQSRQKVNYISLVDIARYKSTDHTDDLIRNWIRNRNTIGFRGIWERLNNPALNPSNSTGLESRPVSTVSP